MTLKTMTLNINGDTMSEILRQFINEEKPVIRLQETKLRKDRNPPFIPNYTQFNMPGQVTIQGSIKYGLMAFVKSSIQVVEIGREQQDRYEYLQILLPGPLGGHTKIVNIYLPPRITIPQTYS